MGTYNSWADVEEELRLLVNKVEGLRDHEDLPDGLCPVKYAKAINVAFRALQDAKLAAYVRRRERVSDERQLHLAHQRAQGIPEIVGRLPGALRPAVPGAVVEGHLNALEVAEREALVRVIAQAGGNMTQVAAGLGMSRNTLYRRMHLLDIPVRRASPTRSIGTVAASKQGFRTPSGAVRSHTGRHATMPRNSKST